VYNSAPLINSIRPVVQLVEHRSPKPGVGGSIPSWPANIFNGSFGCHFWLQGIVMSTESKANNAPLDVVKWIVAAAFLAAAVVGNYLYADAALLYRVLAVVALMLMGAGAAWTTSQGKAFQVLFKEANIERRKVVWPTRQETTQTTMMILAVVVVMSLVLWGLDTLLGWFVSSLVG
jgi:preprotein translocase subunit SecE